MPELTPEELQAALKLANKVLACDKDSHNAHLLATAYKSLAAKLEAAPPCLKCNGTRRVVFDKVGDDGNPTDWRLRPTKADENGVFCPACCAKSAEPSRPVEAAIGPVIHKQHLCPVCHCGQTLPASIQACRCYCHPNDRIVDFINSVVAAPPADTQEWHHGNGFLCCGSLRIARADFDTNPTSEYRDAVFDNICAAMNRQLSPADTQDMSVFGAGKDIRLACPKCNCTMLSGHPMKFCNNCGITLSVPHAAIKAAMSVKPPADTPEPAVPVRCNVSDLRTGYHLCGKCGAGLDKWTHAGDPSSERVAYCPKCGCRLDWGEGEVANALAPEPAKEWRVRN